MFRSCHNIHSTSFRCFSTHVKVNGFQYNIPHNNPVVAMCLDGTHPDYINEALKADKMPYWKTTLRTPVSAGAKAMMSVLNNTSDKSKVLNSEMSFDDIFSMQGSVGTVATAFPTLTNTNNCSIMTGQPPLSHGISGNYFFDPELNKEVLMQSSDYITCDSIFAALAEAGVPVTIVTVKDKLRNLLSHQLPDSPHVKVISVEDLSKNPDKAQKYNEMLGYSEVPDVYNPLASVYAAQLGAELLAQDVNNGINNGFYYITTTDYIQHMYPPGEEVPNTFYNHIDTVLAKMNEYNAVVGVTADHGMNSKCNFDETPRVVYVEDVLNSIGIVNHTVLPITDPYQLHHAGMGGSGMVYIEDQSKLLEAMAHVRQEAGIYAVVGRDDAVKAWDLPPNRIGDMVVVGDQWTAIGKKATDHLNIHEKKGLRSHGSMEESIVLLYVNSPLKSSYNDRLNRGKARNYSIMEYILNGVKGTNDLSMHY